MNNNRERQDKILLLEDDIIRLQNKVLLIPIANSRAVMMSLCSN